MRCICGANWDEGEPCTDHSEIDAIQVSTSGPLDPAQRLAVELAAGLPEPLRSDYLRELVAEGVLKSASATGGGP